MVPPPRTSNCKRIRTKTIEWVRESHARDVQQQSPKDRTRPCLLVCTAPGTQQHATTGKLVNQDTKLPSNNHGVLRLRFAGLIIGTTKNTLSPVTSDVILGCRVDSLWSLHHMSFPQPMKLLLRLTRYRYANVSGEVVRMLADFVQRIID